MREGYFLLLFEAVPARDPENVTLVLESRAVLFGKTCPLRLMVDGKVLAPLAPSTGAPPAPDSARMTVRVPLSVLERFARPHRVVGRVCEDEWRLSEASQVRIEEFLHRVREEAAWSRRAAPDAGAEQERATEHAR